MPLTSSPLIVTLPVSGASSPATIFRNVDFPQPIMPTIDTNSPRSTDSVTSCRTSRVEPVEPNAFETAEISMKGIRIG